MTNGSGVATVSVNPLCGSAYNAGSYPTGVAASFGGASSFGPSSGTNSLTISKATPSVTVTPYNVIYDGQPHTATVGTITGVCGETGATVGTVNVTGTTHTLPGDYPNDPWTFAGAANYNNTNGTVHDSIGYGICVGTEPGGVILPPVNNDGSSVFKRQGGSTIPVKFKVCDASGNFISDPNAVFLNGCCGSVTMLTRMRGTVDDVNETGTTDIPDVAFHQVGNHWQFNLVTTNLDAGYTYTFQIPLKVGSIQFTVAVK
jgi:hypothetical protein